MVSLVIAVSNTPTFFSGTQKYVASPIASAILHAPSKQLLQQIEGHLHPCSINRPLSTVDQGSELRSIYITKVI